jgi:hypothetical protein
VSTLSLLTLGLGAVPRLLLAGLAPGAEVSGTRGLTAAFETETLAAALRPILFVEGEFDSGTLRFWSGVGTLSWNGQDWVGAAGVLAVSPPEETSDTRATGAVVTLNGISSDVLAAVLGEAVQGKPVKAWLGCFDAAGEVVADPYQWMDGHLDVPEILDAGETCTISVSVENRLQALLERAPERRHTSEDHKRDWEGDLFFDFVPHIQDASIPWGRR